MNSRQKNGLNMRIVIVDLLKRTAPSVLVRMPQIEAVTAELESKVETLRRYKNGQNLNRSGNRMTKDILRAEMTQKGFETAAATCAYAVAISNEVLQMEVTYVYSDLTHMRDEDIADACQSIYDITHPLLSDLADYGVTEESLNQLKDIIILYNEALPRTRAGIVVKSNFTQRIAQLFVETDELLFRIDKLVTMVRFSEPVFYADYFNSRKIVDTGNRKLSLRGTVTDSLGQPIDKVLISIDTPNADTAVSTALGNYQFKGVEGGFWSVTYQRDGYITEKVYLAITPNLRVDFNITLRSVAEQERSA